MYKKTVVFSVIFALMLLGLYVGPSAAAQNDVASVSKRGSLLVFPKIRTVDGFDTIITIGNDGGSSVWIKCYWMDEYQKAWDFEVPLTANQPIWFSAKTGNGSKAVSEFGEGVGELKCWAVNINPANASTEVLLKYNYLYGSALVVANNFLQEAFEYEAWAFALARTPNSPAGNLILGVNPATGLQEYDYCPSYLAYNFFAEDANLTDGRPAFEDSYLSLSPCQQDLRQDNAPICTKAKFDVWNENEIKLTGAYQCIKCWFEGELDDIGYEYWGFCDLGDKCKKTGVGGSKFTKSSLHTNMGRFRVSPDTFPACKGVFAKWDQAYEDVVDVCRDSDGQYLSKVYKTPFVGVLVTQVRTVSTGYRDALIATTGSGAGAFTAETQPSYNPGHGPEILWDPGETQQDAAKR